MKKILFLIHDLGQGGAEKVLLNLANNMDSSQFDITVMTLFDCGVNRQFLKPSIRYRTWCHKMIRGNSHLMKLLSPVQLHKLIIKEHYDVEVAYLEGPCARVISGCPDPETKLVSWIHIEQRTAQKAAASFRSVSEAERCYNRFNQIVCVSETVKQDFTGSLHINVPVSVYYNTNETNQIKALAADDVQPEVFLENEIRLVGVGKLLQNKGFDRVLHIVKRLIEEKYPVHLYLLGSGPMQKELEMYVAENALEKQVTFLGYQLNPYQYVKRCDLFVCSSYAEGFSTAATEALIVGTPVCTVEVSGMKEMLGENNEYGVVVPNNEEDLYRGIKRLLDDPVLLAHYKEMAEIRGKDFSTEKTVRAVEDMLEKL